ncbi:hypothetical protein I5E68_07045 [Novosphingobium sp. YJ-S2-02]|uniref:Uncharacterized protein n=1 Tax=Novosphingobium aureum TaxID=2792964 RepID=A0A931ML54_9SPHN|nr:hypothetical protein [Novosphingobium aureum]MBH0112706.1 hypothetical protein [Novosphingobium aureum]
MAEIPLPTGDLENVKIELDQNFQVNRSIWTGRRRVSGMPGAQRWFGSFNVARMTEDEERPWRAFLLSLRGPVHRFRLPVACNQRTGTNPTVRTGAGSGTTLPLENLPANATPLLAGHYLTVPLPSGHHRLVMLTEDLQTNGTGQGTATLTPELMQIPAEGTVVETIAPYMHAALIDPRQGWQVTNGVSAFTINAEEAL